MDKSMKDREEENNQLKERVKSLEEEVKPLKARLKTIIMKTIQQ